MTTFPDHITQAVESPRRPESDRLRDAGRKPAELLAFYHVGPGQKVAELNTGRGYFVGLLSEAVGEEGKVYAHTTEASAKRWKGNPVDDRIKECGLTNVETRLSAAIDSPDLESGLDSVFMIMCYHDTVWIGADRPKLLKTIHEALKPGGHFCVVDHHAAPGKGLDDCHETHRIEKSVVIDEVTSAGFELVSESDCLENLDDPLDCGPHGKGIRDHTHRFVLKFVKA